MSAYNDNNIFLGDFFGKRLTDGNNQHIIALWEGKTGQGKSSAAIHTAYWTSVYLADKLGGRPEDYFTADNVAVITEDEILRVSQNIKKHGIYILDDIGIGLSAREWQSKGNKIMTNILQTFRTYNNLLILTVPDKGFIDKIGRNLLHYKVVMDKQLFTHGKTFGKFSMVKTKYYKDTGGNMYPFLRGAGKVYTRVEFDRPPQHLIDKYEAKRDKIQKEMQEKSLQELRELQEPKVSNLEKKVTVKEKVWELKRDVEAGIYKSLKQACEMNDVNYGYAKQISYKM